MGPPRPLAVETAQLYGGVGGLILQAHDDRLTLVYSNTDSVVQCSGAVGVVWLSRTSYDGGGTWGPSDVIFSSSNQPTCLPGPGDPPFPATQVQPGLRNFGFAEGPAGEQWVAVPDQGATGVRMYVRHLEGSEYSGWEWHDLVPAPEGQLVFHPTLAADPYGEALLTFHAITKARDSTGHRWTTWMSAPNVLGYWSAPRILDPQPSYQERNVGTVRDPGDYMGVAVMPLGAFPPTVREPNGRPVPATFFPVWSRHDSLPSDVSTVVGAGVRVSP